MEALASGEPLAWFERLYREAQTSGAVVPWADYRPNPNLVSWLDAGACLARGRALDIGCGFGDDAEELSRRGFDVTAFDISESAIAVARQRFPGTRVAYQAANLLQPPLEWRRTFAFVLEAYTLQVLPLEQRIAASRELAGLVAPGGVLLVIARGREPSDDAGAMPWPLTRAEVEAIATDGVRLVRLDDFVDAEEPPVRRFRAVFERSAG